MTRDEAIVTRHGTYKHTLTCGHEFVATAAYLHEIYCGPCMSMRDVEVVDR